MAEMTVRPLSDVKAVSEQPLAARAPHVRKTADAAEKFESFVLQSFIQEMMPKQAEGVFGAGISGDFWKSMMSEKIAEQVAARGGLGIADTVRAGHEAPMRPTGGLSLGVMSHLSTLNSLSAPLPGAEPDTGV